MSTETGTISHRSFWSSLVAAIKGHQEDYTEGKLSRAITLLAIPMVLEMVMESVFAVVDAFYVAKLGDSALATIGLTEALMQVLFCIGIGLGMPTTAMVARRIGEKRSKAAGESAMQASLLGILIGAVLGLVGGLFAPELLGLMKATPEIVEGGAGYARVLLSTNVVILLLFLNNASLRGAGDANYAMRALWLANGINIFLDPCLIFGWGPFPEMGLTGAAVATAIGRGTGVVYQFWVMSRNRGRLEWPRKIIVRPEIMLDLARRSIGGIGQFLIGSASWIVLIAFMATFGTTAAAAYTVAIRIVVFAILPSWGLSNSAATLVGQNLGANKPDRAERSVWLAGLFNMIFLAVVSVVLIVFARPLVGIFTDDAELLPIAVDGLRIISYGYVFYAWGMVMVQAFNGAGDTVTPTYVNLFCFWVCQIPIAYVMANLLGFGPSGIYWAIAISYSIEAVVGVILFRRGSWKTRVV